jgi:hypothetical protein
LNIQWTLALRKLLARIIIVAIVTIAALVNVRQSSATGREWTGYWWLRRLRWIVRSEVIRTVGHLMVFGTVALLLGPWGRNKQRGSQKLVWWHVIIGGVAIESGQIATRKPNLSLSLIRSTLFDLVINALGALLGLFLLRFLKKPLDR